MSSSLSVQLDRLERLQNDTASIRNICILAHVDHGKTTLSDCLVSSNGIISERLAGTIRYLDSREDEQERGITMQSSAISLYYQHERLNKEFLINLIDSPGHVDFSSDVSTAVRLCDGALIVVDVIEGVAIQTHAVLRQAWEERLQPCLVLNKIDRLIVELQLEPVEAYEHLQRIIENVNAILQGFVSASVMSSSSNSDGTEDQQQVEMEEENTETNLEGILEYNDAQEEALIFSPEKGNVVFASATDSWAFRVIDFVPKISEMLGIANKRKILKSLWGNYYYNPKTKKIISLKQIQTSMTVGESLRSKPPMFATFILESIWHVYRSTVIDMKPKRLEKIVEKLGLRERINKRELGKGGKAALRAVMHTWLPVTRTILSMVIRCIPDPKSAQKRRIEILWPKQRPPPQHAEQLSIVKSGIENCDANAPFVCFVTKIFAVQRSQLPAKTLKRVLELRALSKTESEPSVAGNQDDAQKKEEDEEFLFAFARIFSGRAKAGVPVFVLGPKYKLEDDDDYSNNNNSANKKTGQKMVVAQGLLPLLIMNTELVALDDVPSGNIVALAGLDEAVLKTATVTTSPKCYSLSKMPIQSAPILRVSMEPEDPLQWSKLAEGLRMLNRADPVAEVKILPNGEHILGAIGELHLERCVKDLEERFAKVKLKVSKPLAMFRETLVLANSNSNTVGGQGQSSQQQQQNIKVSPKQTFALTEAVEGEGGDAFGSNPPSPPRMLDDQDRISSSHQKQVYPGGQILVNIMMGLVKVTIRALPLPLEVTHKLESLQPKLAKLQLQQQQQDQEEMKANQKLLREELLQVFQNSDNDWDESMFNRIWAFGPKGVGPNILFNNTSNFLKERRRSALLFSAMDDQNDDKDDDEEIISGIMAGFQLACRAGPLCEEPLWGCAILIQNIERAKKDENQEDVGNNTREEEFGLSGQVMTGIRDGIRRAFNVHRNQHKHGIQTGVQVRLVEGMFKCLLQCHVESHQGDQLGKLYSVISKRRGKVLMEDMWEGTSIFTIEALIPVVESFKLGDDLRHQTSGAASTPQLVFSHWQIIDENPFFVPTTEDELEEFGQHGYQATHNRAHQYLEQIRKRKGLQTTEKVVVAAEKQRTLTRNK